MTNKTLISILVVVALVIGVVAIINLFNTGTPSTSNTPNGNTDNTSQNQQTEQPAPDNPYGVTGSDVVSLEAPGQNASEEEILDYTKKVSSVAVDAATAVLDISACLPNPKVVRATPGASISVRNSDTASHSLTAGETVILTANAGTESKLKINLNNPGIYGYKCDGNGPVGIFQIVTGE